MRQGRLPTLKHGGSFHCWRLRGFEPSRLDPVCAKGRCNSAPWPVGQWCVADGPLTPYCPSRAGASGLSGSNVQVPFTPYTPSLQCGILLKGKPPSVALLLVPSLALSLHHALSVCRRLQLTSAYLLVALSRHFIAVTARLL